MSDSEFNAVIELLIALVFDWRTGTLFLLLITAAVIDILSHRIPNWLVLSGVLFGAIYNVSFLPFSLMGPLWPLGGVGLGLLVFFPLYLLGVMGAGDVKLMAMVGAFVGPLDMIWVLLYSMITGGVLSIFLALARGTAGRMFTNITALFRLGLLNTISGSRPDFQIAASASAGKLPYALAIAIGSIAYLILHQLGFL